MSFGTAKEKVKMLAYQQDNKVLILDMSDVLTLDYTSSRAIKGLVNGTLDAGRKIVVARAPGEPCALLDRERILQVQPMRYRHFSRLSAQE